MQPFYHIVPEAPDPTWTLVLDRKTGAIPKGRYGFVEYYCTDPDCDCRRVLVLVFNEKLRPKAAIGFGFDQEGPFAGPYLDTSNPQAPYAPDLLSFFADALNAGPQWLLRLYRQYRLVREKLEGRPYLGRPFPEHGRFYYRPMPQPDLEAGIEQSLRQLENASGAKNPFPKLRRRIPGPPPGFPEEGEEIVTGAPRGGPLDLHGLKGEEVIAGIARSIEATGVASPFEGVQALLGLFALNEPDLQLAVLAELVEAEKPLLREMAALMLFSPEPEVSLGVSRILASADGRSTTSDTLRRLIVARNWFAGQTRKNLDLAILNARKGRVECAPLAKAPPMKVYASPLTGNGAQTFHVVVPIASGFYSCSIRLKEGAGVADAFVSTLADRAQLKKFMEAMAGDGYFLESTAEFLDRRVCHALADGLLLERVPGPWLVRIAELLGRDRWLPASLDAAAETERLRGSLSPRHRMLLSDIEYRTALEESGEWHRRQPVLATWVEETGLVARELEGLGRGPGAIGESAAVKRILEAILEPRREIWRERLVLEALWLRSVKRAPIAWHQVLHLAQAVGNREIPVGEIPFMRSVARSSYQAFSRSAGGADTSKKGAPR